MIFITKTDKKGNDLGEVMFKFDAECTKADDSFTCKLGGATVLSGTTYKKVRGNSNVCDTPNWPEYRCTAGCNKPGVPAYFAIDPYEC
jgi:hypothetical protein